MDKAQLFLQFAFICSLRRLRVASALSDMGADQVWGLWGPDVLYNVDQVPLPFASDDPITVAFKGEENVWIRQAGDGLDKRQVYLLPSLWCFNFNNTFFFSV